MRVSPVALLVVPDYHGLGRADKDALESLPLRYCALATSATAPSKVSGAACSVSSRAGHW